MGNFFFFKDYRELWTKCCRRGMQVVKWVQYPLGTLLSAPEASKNATKEGQFSEVVNISVIFITIIWSQKKLFKLQLCTYYTDPEVCIGPVASAQVSHALNVVDDHLDDHIDDHVEDHDHHQRVDVQNKRVMQHTAGEKRQSAHPDHSYLRYRRWDEINSFHIRWTGDPFHLPHVLVLLHY